MKQGDIYYNTDLNLYYVIIDVNLMDNKFDFLIFNGFKTDHDFRGDGNMNYKDFKCRDNLVQVGGIY